MGSSRVILIVIIILNVFSHGYHTTTLELGCMTKPCIFEEGDIIELTCSYDDEIEADDVNFNINHVDANVDLKKKTGRSEVQASLVAKLDHNGKFVSCTVAGGRNSNSAMLHVLALPAIPEIISCQRLKQRQSIIEDTFQCLWKPIMSTNKNSVMHQLIWSRRYLDDVDSPLDWKPCPNQVDESCTWLTSDNSTTFFGDDDGSTTDGWENCVAVVAKNKIDKEYTKNITSQLHCFSMSPVPEEGMSGSTVAGIVIGVVLLVLLVPLILGILRCIRKQKKQMKIEVPGGVDIQMEDKQLQDSHYYTDGNDAPQSTWQDSWLNSAVTPSTANSAIPLLNSDQRQHFSFPNVHENNYFKSKLPNDKARLDKVQTKDQTDLINRLLANNNDDKPNAGITYAVIKTPDINNKLDDIKEINHQSEEEDGDQPTYTVNTRGDDGEDFESRDDGIYKIDLPWPVRSNPEEVHSSQGSNSVTSYTVIAPSPVRKPRNLVHSHLPSEEV